MSKFPRNSILILVLMAIFVSSIGIYTAIAESKKASREEKAQQSKERMRTDQIERYRAFASSSALTSLRASDREIINAGIEKEIERLQSSSTISEADKLFIAKINILMNSFKASEKESATVREKNLKTFKTEIESSIAKQNHGTSSTKGRVLSAKEVSRLSSEQKAKQYTLATTSESGSTVTYEYVFHEATDRPVLKVSKYVFSTKSTLSDEVMHKIVIASTIKEITSLTKKNDDVSSVKEVERKVVEPIKEETSAPAVELDSVETVATTTVATTSPTIITEPPAVEPGATSTDQVVTDQVVATSTVETNENQDE